MQSADLCSYVEGLRVRQRLGRDEDLAWQSEARALAAPIAALLASDFAAEGLPYRLPTTAPEPPVLPVEIDKRAAFLALVSCLTGCRLRPLGRLSCRLKSTSARLF